MLLPGPTLTLGLITYFLPQKQQSISVFGEILVSTRESAAWRILLRSKIWDGCIDKSSLTAKKTLTLCTGGIPLKWVHFFHPHHLPNTGWMWRAKVQQWLPCTVTWKSPNLYRNAGFHCTRFHCSFLSVNPNKLSSAISSIHRKPSPHCPLIPMRLLHL